MPRLDGDRDAKDAKVNHGRNLGRMLQKDRRKNPGECVRRGFSPHVMRNAAGIRSVGNKAGLRSLAKLQRGRKFRGSGPGMFFPQKGWG
jgi:hypothetical protein